MECPCCETKLTRAENLPETRGWMRFGDQYCADCSWVIARELLDEGETLAAEICPEHGEAPAFNPTPP
jgi:hypothetical protein